MEILKHSCWNCSTMAFRRKPSSLTTAIWNANGRLKSQKVEFLDFVQRYQLGIVLVNETHFRGQDRFSIANFTTYSNDRQGARRGGTTILVNSNLDHHVNSISDLRQMECTSVVVTTFDVYGFRV
ncbi:hypothetical protein AMK59_2895 [Oryctes borbonicus]|uniref:Endonuclease/exonuclease/phosphatase domain-containing protein n=1 Tax=Oryctes borbonicus TaxID=1629725 RepID=A0A0T6BH71_9SCAR|nr:hypothetical protein AMK59_2895 [Oryctes borbonicus]